MSDPQITELGSAFALPSYREFPVDPDQFFMDDYYLGIGAGKNLRPDVKKDLLDFYSKEHYIWVADGAVGRGKSFGAAECPFCYEIYKTGILDNPQEYVGLAPGTTIYFATLADVEDNARDKIFSGVKAKIMLSPWFQKNMPFDPNKKSELDFGYYDKRGKFVSRNITFRYFATSMSGPISKDIYTAAFDEVNFMPIVKNSRRNRRQTSEFDMAQRLVNALDIRIHSRFMDKKTGNVPGKIFIISQSEYPDDFTERKRKEYEGKPWFFYTTGAVWKGYGEGSFANWFRIQIPQPKLFPNLGLSNKDLKVLGDDEKLDKGCKEFKAPVVWKEKLLNQDGSVNKEALLQLGGIRITDLGGRFIGEVTWNRARKNPVEVFETVIDDLKIEKHKLCQKGTVVVDGKIDYEWVPIINPDAPRFIHIDASLGAEYPFGFAMCHPVGIIENLKRDENEPAVKVCVDLVLRIVRDQNGKISYRKVRELIYDLSDWGFDIMGISFDQFQSESWRQPLEERGFYVEEVSVETSIRPYQLLSSAIDENRWDCYYNPLLEEEFRDVKLESMGQRWKILTRKFKDVADCCAGSMFLIYKNLENLSLPQLWVKEKTKGQNRKSDREEILTAIKKEEEPEKPFVGLDEKEADEVREEENISSITIGRFNSDDDDDEPESDRQEDITTPESMMDRAIKQNFKR